MEFLEGLRAAVEDKCERVKEADSWVVNASKVRESVDVLLASLQDRLHNVFRV